MEDNGMKITSVKGTNDYLPNEVEIRDYLQNEILKVYVENGFEHITTPVIEDIENLDKSDGGENLNLIFKIMKRGDKLDKMCIRDRFYTLSKVGSLLCGILAVFMAAVFLMGIV